MIVKLEYNANQTVRPFVLHVGDTRIRLTMADLEEIAKVSRRWIQ
jgi:hypothetical protein